MDSPSIQGSLQATLSVWHVRDRGDKDLNSGDQKAAKLQAALDIEVDGFLMGLQRTDAPLGSPVERFKYPHFFLSTGQHFNSRGARVRQGRAEALPFVYEFPRFVSGGGLLGTGVGWLSLNESQFEHSAYAVDRPMVGRLGCNGGLARVQFPTSGLSGSCEAVSATLKTQNFAGEQQSESTVSLGFWTDGILPTSRCLFYDESRSRIFVASRAGESSSGPYGGIVSVSTKSGETLWHQHVSAGSVELSPNGRLLMATTGSGMAFIDPKTGQPTHRLKEKSHSGEFTPMSTRWIDDRVTCWLGGDKFYALGGVETSGAITLQVREVKTGQMIWELPLENPVYESPRSDSKCCAAPNRFIRSVSASPCGRLIAFVAGDLYLVDGGSGEVLQTIKARDAIRTWEGASFSPDGKYLAVASHEILAVFDCKKAKSLSTGAPSSSQFLRRISSFWLD